VKLGVSMSLELTATKRKRSHESEEPPKKLQRAVVHNETCLPVELWKVIIQNFLFEKEVRTLFFVSWTFNLLIQNDTQLHIFFLPGTLTETSSFLFEGFFQLGGMGERIEVGI
jgi:hypothetical protein